MKRRAGFSARQRTDPASHAEDKFSTLALTCSFEPTPLETLTSDDIFNIRDKFPAVYDGLLTYDALLKNCEARYKAKESELLRSINVGQEVLNQLDHLKDRCATLARERDAGLAKVQRFTTQQRAPPSTIRKGDTHTAIHNGATDAQAGEERIRIVQQKEALASANRRTIAAEERANALQSRLKELENEIAVQSTRCQAEVQRRKTAEAEMLALREACESQASTQKRLHIEWETERERLSAERRLLQERLTEAQSSCEMAQKAEAHRSEELRQLRQERDAQENEVTAVIRKEARQLQQVLAERDREVEDGLQHMASLRVSLQQTVDECLQLRHKLGAAESRAAEQAAWAEEQRATLASVRGEKETLEQRLGDTQRNLLEARQEKKALEESLEILRAQTQRIEAELSRMTGDDVAGGKAAAQRAVRRVELLESALTAKQNEMERLRREHMEQIDDLRSSLQGARQATIAAEQRVSAATARKKEQQEKSEEKSRTLQIQLDECVRRLEQRQAENSYLKRTVERLSTELEAQQVVIQRSERRVRELQKELRDGANYTSHSTHKTQDRFEEVRGVATAEWDKLLQSKEAQMVALHENIRRLDQTLSTRDEALRASQTNLQELKTQMIEMETAEALREGKLAALQKANQQLDDECNSLRQEAQQYSQRIALMESARSSTDCQHAYHEALEVIAVYRAKQEHYERELEKEKGRLCRVEELAETSFGMSAGAPHILKALCAALNAAQQHVGDEWVTQRLADGSTPGATVDTDRSLLSFHGQQSEVRGISTIEPQSAGTLPRSYPFGIGRANSPAGSSDVSRLSIIEGGVAAVVAAIDEAPLMVEFAALLRQFIQSMYHALTGYVNIHAQQWEQARERVLSACKAVTPSVGAQPAVARGEEHDSERWQYERVAARVRDTADRLSRLYQERVQAVHSTRKDCETRLQGVLLANEEYAQREEQLRRSLSELGRQLQAQAESFRSACSSDEQLLSDLRQQAQMAEDSRRKAVEQVKNLEERLAAQERDAEYLAAKLSSQLQEEKELHRMECKRHAQEENKLRQFLKEHNSDERQGRLEEEALRETIQRANQLLEKQLRQERDSNEQLRAQLSGVREENKQMQVSFQQRSAAAEESLRALEKASRHERQQLLAQHRDEMELLRHQVHELKATQDAVKKREEQMLTAKRHSEEELTRRLAMAEKEKVNTQQQLDLLRKDVLLDRDSHRAERLELEALRKVNRVLEDRLKEVEDDRDPLRQQLHSMLSINSVE